MLKFLEKINPLNWIENFVVKRLIKKVTKGFPSLKAKAIEVLKNETEEILQKVKVTILEYVEKYKNKA